MIAFKRSRLKQGMVLHSRSYGWFGRKIRKVLSARGKNPVWGNHDGILILYKGKWVVGESVPMRAKLTPLLEYERMMEAGECEVRVYDIKDATIEMRLKACTYWLSYVLDTLYDFLAFPRLYIKAMFLDIFDKEVGWEWAHWCTEGVAYAWKRGAGYDVWDKTNPTPWTTEKRVGTNLVDVTKDIITEVK